MLTRIASFATALMCAAPVLAQQDLITAEIRPGWRTADGTHMAALVFRMAPGWHTYWRAPGDAGIPPLIDWSGSENIDTLEIVWPTPEVYWIDGYRSIVYHDQVVLPLEIDAAAGGDITLTGSLQVGVCSDICVPAFLDVSALLPADSRSMDPSIVAAMVDQPHTETEAAVRDVSCQVSPDPRGLRLQAEITLPHTGGTEETVVETSNPEVWVATPKTARSGNRLQVETLLVHVDRAPFALDRSGLRFTVLGDKYAVDIQGCS